MINHQMSPVFRSQTLVRQYNCPHKGPFYKLTYALKLVRLVKVNYLDISYIWIPTVFIKDIFGGRILFPEWSHPILRNSRHRSRNCLTLLLMDFFKINISILKIKSKLKFQIFCFSFDRVNLYAFKFPLPPIINVTIEPMQ